MRRALPILAAALLVGALAQLADARPGGGESYSGGGGFGGGDSGGGGGEGAAVIFELLFRLVFHLIIEAPAVGIPVLLVVIIGFIYSMHKSSVNKDWNSGPPVAFQPPLPHKAAPSLDVLRNLDPDFSRVVFEDFIFRLFSAAHRARHTQATLDALGPYLSEAARATLAAREPAGERVESVVVGALRTHRIDVPAGPTDEHGRITRVWIDVELEANVTTAKHTYYSVEHWLFARVSTVRTRPPGTRTFPCPNCGAPWQTSATGTQVCAYCNEVVDNGRFDWMVDSIRLRWIDERPPTLTNEVPERGTDLPTVFQPHVTRHWNELCQDDPALHATGVDARFRMIFTRLNEAWSRNDLRPVRGLVSDGLYDYLQYWVEAYQRQGLRNELADVRITQSTTAKVARDRWYDAITLRFWATGKDYVVRASDGKVVRGSKSRERAYSEYWTLIRASNRRGAPVASPSCSNCGAPLQISMAGECEHCNAHVSAGEFDWVLSKIEQDDSYRG